MDPITIAYQGDHIDFSHGTFTGTGQVVGKIEAQHVYAHAPVPTALDALPAAPTGFTGRAETPADVLDALSPVPASGRGAAAVVVAGLASVGKTSLALVAAHTAWTRGTPPDVSAGPRHRGPDLRREKARDLDGAERLYREAADTGHAHALADLRQMASEHDGAERLRALLQRGLDADDDVPPWTVEIGPRAGFLTRAPAAFFHTSRSAGYAVSPNWETPGCDASSWAPTSSRTSRRSVGRSRYRSGTRSRYCGEPGVGSTLPRRLADGGGRRRR